MYYHKEVIEQKRLITSAENGNTPVMANVVKTKLKFGNLKLYLGFRFDREIQQKNFC